MIQAADYHVHSVFSDGKDDIESIILTAIEKGLTEIGISDHSYTSFDGTYCIEKSKEKEYVAEVKRLKEKYVRQIKVLCGTELDAFSDIDLSCYDYAIGSSHYFKKGDKYYPIDESREKFVNAVEEVFGGDFYAACEEYFATVAKFASYEKVGIIGHFDLVTKFNGQGDLFDEENERYVKAYTSAVKTLAAAGKTFEINTGALRKGLRKDAYPAAKIRAFIKERGGKFILSSDSHKKEDLTFGFSLYEKEL
ncbi:MAG: histidinol-phosphatase HisJ family protein [Clostridia bacterium]|nr:histidinol-phosphatase HisJ family protein [Clostridia bacterium]